MNNNSENDIISKYAFIDDEYIRILSDVIFEKIYISDTDYIHPTLRIFGMSTYNLPSSIKIKGFLRRVLLTNPNYESKLVIQCIFETEILFTQYHLTYICQRYNACYIKVYIPDDDVEIIIMPNTFHSNYMVNLIKIYIKISQDIVSGG